MAAPALLVKGVGQQRALPFALLSFVAFFARGRRLPLLVDVMMALRALETDSLSRGVLLVIKEHVSGSAFEHDSYGDFRRLGRVGGIQGDPHQKKERRQGVGQVNSLFSFHFYSSSETEIQFKSDRRVLRKPPLTRVEWNLVKVAIGFSFISQIKTSFLAVRKFPAPARACIRRWRPPGNW
jgi:hypothetical protein